MVTRGLVNFGTTIVCHRFGANPLFKSLFVCCDIDHEEHFQWNVFDIFATSNVNSHKMLLEMTYAKCRPPCSGLDVLIQYATSRGIFLCKLLPIHQSATWILIKTSYQIIITHIYIYASEYHFLSSCHCTDFCEYGMTEHIIIITDNQL